MSNQEQKPFFPTIRYPNNTKKSTPLTNTAYEYDSTGRLIQAGQQSFIYDARGNLRTKTNIHTFLTTKYTK